MGLPTHPHEADAPSWSLPPNRQEQRGAGGREGCEGGRHRARRRADRPAVHLRLLRHDTDDPLAAVADATYDRSAIYFTPAFTQANAPQLQAWSASEFIAAPGPDTEARLVSQLNAVGWSIDETSPPTTCARTADDPDIDGLAGGTLSSIVVDGGLNVPLMPFLPITADIWPTVIDGTVPRSDGEVLVGVDVLDALGADFEADLPDMIFFDLADGVDPQTVIDRYPDGMPDLSAFSATEWLTSLAPAEVLETDRASGLIWSVIALLGLAVLASLGHALAGSVRQHRRDYATLKAIGFTKRQVLSSVTWQSTAPVVLALVLALPLGTALGRWWWRMLAQLIGVGDTPVMPVASLVLVASGALVASALVAVRPGLRAARTPAAMALQDE